MEKIKMNNVTFIEVAKMYTLIQFTNLLGDEEKELQIYEQEVENLSKKLVEKGLTNKQVQFIKDKAMENFMCGYADAYLHDIVDTCNIGTL